MAYARRKMVVKSASERDETRRRAVDDSRSKNTHRQYASNWAGWEAYCAECDYPTLPARPEDVAEYLAARFYDAECSASTANSDSAAINDTHRSAGFTPPGYSDEVRTVMRGIRRRGKIERPPHQAPPMTLESLDRIAAADIDPMHQAWLEIGFAGALRRSEGSALNCGDFVDGKLYIAFSKTDQEAEGAWVRLSKRAALYAQWCADGLVDDAPLFRSRKGKRCAPITLARWVRVNAEYSEIPNGSDYSGHSLRRGCALAMSQRGIPLSEIAEHGRWKSVDTVLRYLWGADTSRAVAVLDE